MSYTLHDIDEYSKMRGRKLQIFPTDEQKIVLQTMAKLYIDVYNWALQWDIDYYNDNHKKPLVSKMFCVFRDMRNTPGSKFQDIPVTVARFAILEVMNSSLNLFFLGVNKFPKFKKFNEHDWWFKVPNEQFRFYVKPDGIRIQGIQKRTLIPVEKHYIDDNGNFYNVTIKRHFDTYTVSMNECIDEEMRIKNIIFNEKYPKTGPIGIDVGVVNWITCSNGKVFHTPDLQIEYKRLSRLQSRIDSYRHDNNLVSSNQKRRIEEFYDLQNRIHDTEITCMRMAVAEIIKCNPAYIVREDLDSEGMRQHFSHEMNFKLDRSKFGTLHDWIDKAAQRRDIPVYKVSRWYPSSQLCSNCGQRNHKTSSRTFVCRFCGFTIDRDLNAAINLKNADISQLKPCNGVRID